MTQQQQQTKSVEAWRHLANISQVLRMFRSQKNSLNENRSLIHKPLPRKRVPNHLLWYRMQPKLRMVLIQKHTRKLIASWNGCPIKKNVCFYWVATKWQTRKKMTKQFVIEDCQIFLWFFAINVRNMLMKTHNNDKKKQAFRLWKFALVVRRKKHTFVQCFRQFRPQLVLNEETFAADNSQLRAHVKIGPGD